MSQEVVKCFTSVMKNNENILNGLSEQIKMNIKNDKIQKYKIDLDDLFREEEDSQKIIQFLNFNISLNIKKKNSNEQVGLVNLSF